MGGRAVWIALVDMSFRWAMLDHCLEANQLEVSIAVLRSLQVSHMEEETASDTWTSLEIARSISLCVQNKGASGEPTPGYWAVF